MLSPIALEQFSKTGFLSLSDTQISLDDISCLKKHFQSLIEKPRDYGTDFSGYGINLKDMVVMLDALPQSHEQVLTGRVIEYPSRTWKESYTDVALGQMASIHGFHTPFNVRDPKENRKVRLNKLMESLVSLFVQPWSFIKLENVFICDGNQIDYLSNEDFYNGLLESLSKNKVLRRLILKPFSLIRHEAAIVDFLNENTELQRLRLQITEADKQGWQELCYAVSNHPNLEYFHLDTSTLDANAYLELIKLLDTNYHIKLSVPAPTDRNLLKAYAPLAQRLSISGFERFKEDHLSQDKLLQVAIDTLKMTQESNSNDMNQVEIPDFKKQLFDFLIANKGQLAITAPQKKYWIKSAGVLPYIYQRHQDYLMQASDLVQLQMDVLSADENKTIGYVLLENALEIQNLAILKTLLNAKVNLFEFPNNNEEPFLVKVLQNKGDLKQTVVEYIKQDQRLVALAEKYLAHYPDLKDLFGKFKDHLDQYSSHLVRKDSRYTLLSISNEVLGICRNLLGLQNPADSRGKECAQIYFDLDKSLQVINTTREVTYKALREIQLIMQKIKQNSQKALRGAFNRSLLHEKVINLIDQFDEKLELSKDQINEQKDEKIKHLQEYYEKQRSAFNDKSAKMEAENDDLRAKQTQLEAQILELTRRQMQEQARAEPRGFRP